MAALLAVLTVAGCHSGHPTATPTAGSTPPLSPTTSATPADTLKQLATVAAAASYRATYTARQSHPATTATWQLWRTPTSLRVDVVTPRVTATLIVTPKASYSCRAAKHHKTCFRVAKAGQPVPAPFHLLAQPLFSTNVDILAKHSDSYVVTATAPEQGSARVPAATCFALRPLAGAPKPRVEQATYCFSAAGVLTSITYPSGNVVRLRHVTMTAPARGAFAPYSSPTPLPG